MSKESEKNYSLRYEELWKQANEYAKLGIHEEAETIIRYMMQTWPKRRIARGKIISEPDILNNQLKTALSVP